MQDVRALPTVAIKAPQEKSESEVGNQHVLIALLLGVVSSAFLTPFGGVVVFLVVFAIGQHSKNAALAMLAEIRREDAEERALLGERGEE